MKAKWIDESNFKIISDRAKSNLMFQCKDCMLYTVSASKYLKSKTKLINTHRIASDMHYN